MLAEKFIEQVKKFPDKLAIETPDCSLTYTALDKFSSIIAQALTDQEISSLSNRKQPVVVLLFENGVDVIIGLVSAIVAIVNDLTDISTRLGW